jgi:hypothetical protein
MRRSSELCRSGDVFSLRSPAAARRWRLGASSGISRLQQCDHGGSSFADCLLSSVELSLIYDSRRQRHAAHTASDIAFKTSTSPGSSRPANSFWSQSGLPSRQYDRLSLPLRRAGDALGVHACQFSKLLHGIARWPRAEPTLTASCSGTQQRKVKQEV